MKFLIVAFMIVSIHSYAKEFPEALVTMNGNFILTAGDARCDKNVSLWGYQDISVNLENNRDVYFTEINNGRTSGRCTDGLGSKYVYNTTFKGKTLTSFVSEDSIGCLTPKRAAKLVKESELIILEKDSFILTTLMRSDKPIYCSYKSVHK